MNDLSGTDGCEVAVTLIGEYDPVGIGTLYACSDSGSAAVSRFYAVKVEILITEYCAADGNDGNGAILNAKLFNDLGYEPMNDTMTAAGAVMQYGIGQNRGFLKYSLHN